MKCREKLAIVSPESIDITYLGGCEGCPHDRFSIEKPEWCAVTETVCRRCWDRELPSGSVIEHDGCSGCKHDSKTADEEPCVKCKGTVITFSDEYEARQDLYEPMEDEETTEEDPVNHPSHYNREGGMECIDEMVLVFGREAVKNFCLLNVWKYRYRAADKSGAEDLEKSDNYMRKYKELCEDDRTEAI